MMQQLVSYMMGKGDVSLAGTIHDTVVAGIREEVRKEMRQEYQGIIDDQAAEIAALKALQNHDDEGGESPQTTIKKLEQRNQDLNRDLHGQKTEGKYNGRNNMTPADEADLNGEDVPESTFDVSDDEFTEIMDGINGLRNNEKPSVGCRANRLSFRYYLPDGAEVESGERNDERETTATTVGRSCTNPA
jgi:hypothetical protein